MLQKILSLPPIMASASSIPTTFRRDKASLRCV
ncbi:hypothetical protein I315_02682 [Cryptococcus gattii Ru294]|nr:hypothetical protein I315_02682 [Cryptococcus gattii Ru294]